MTLQTKTVAKPVEDLEGLVTRLLQISEDRLLDRYSDLPYDLALEWVLGLHDLHSGPFPGAASVYQTGDLLYFYQGRCAVSEVLSLVTPRLPARLRRYFRALLLGQTVLRVVQGGRLD